MSFSLVVLLDVVRSAVQGVSMSVTVDGSRIKSVLNAANPGDGSRRDATIGTAVSCTVRLTLSFTTIGFVLHDRPRSESRDESVLLATA